MPPAEVPSCRDRDMLSARLRADLKVYAEAVSLLQKSMGPDFKKTHKKAEQARLAYEAGSTGFGLASPAG